MAKRGYPKVSEWFPDLSDAVKEQVKKELLDGAEQIKASAEANINMQFRVISGKLKASVYTKKLSESGMYIGIGANAFNPKDGVNYARVLEFSPHEHGHPFFMPAYYRHKDEIHEKILDAIRRGVKNFNDS